MVSRLSRAGKQRRLYVPQPVSSPLDTTQHTVVGVLQVLPGVYSPQLDNRRDILVYLPPSYEREPNRRYPVLYMHDGQNLFDQATSFAGEWCVDETLQALSWEGIEAIVAGIPNMGRSRIDEYSPFRDGLRGGQGEAYLAFLVDTIKPQIDQQFRTLPARTFTGIMGSSMGGLISLYAFFRYPEVFGFAGIMSPSLWFAKRAVFKYVQQAPAVPGKIYLDVGSSEGPENARRMRDVLMAKSYRLGDNLMYVEERHGRHHESAWARRLPDALRFLIPGSSGGGHSMVDASGAG